jgi:hypothetical protein
VPGHDSTEFLFIILQGINLDIKVIILNKIKNCFLSGRVGVILVRSA